MGVKCLAEVWPPHHRPRRHGEVPNDDFLVTLSFQAWDGI